MRLEMDMPGYCLETRFWFIFYDIEVKFIHTVVMGSSSVCVCVYLSHGGGSPDGEGVRLSSTRRG